METLHSPTDTLVSLLQPSSETAFILTGFTHPKHRDHWIDDLALALQDTQHIIVDLRNTHVEQLGKALEEKLPDGLLRGGPSNALVHIINLEATLVEELQEGTSDLFARLDAEAESLPRLLTARCVWWTDAFTLSQIEQNAPRLWKNIAHKIPPSPPASPFPAVSTLEGWLSLGNELVRESRLAEATMAFQKAGLIAQAAKDKSSLARIEAGMGEIYQSFGLYTEALAHYSKALEEEFEALDLARLHFLKGQSLAHLKEPQQALEELQLALEAFEEENRMKELGETLSEMGQLHLLLGNSGAALAHLHTAIEAYEEASSYREAAEIQHFLASHHERQGPVQKAIDHYREAAASFQKADDNLMTAKAWQHAGGLLKNIRAWQDSRSAFEKALNYARKTRDEFLIASLEDSLEYLNEKHPGPGQKKPGKGLFGKLFG